MYEKKSVIKIFYDNDWGWKLVPELSSLVLCHSKNKPPAMQGEGESLDISMSSCAKMKVGLQNHK